MSKRRSWIGIVGILSILVPASWDTSRADEFMEGFTETFEVSVVEVDVLVTDRDDQPVTDLDRKDFRLYEDGEPVEITNFYTIREGRRPDLDPALADSIERLYLAIFVDDLNISAESRNRVLEQVEEFVGQALRPEDFAMVVRSADRVRIEQGLTQDSDSVAAALTRIRGNPSRGGATALDRRAILAEIERTSSGGGSAGLGSRGEESVEFEAGSILSSIETHAQSRHDLLRATTGLLGELVADLGGLPGRKALLYVSDNISYRPGEDLFRAWKNKFGDISRSLRFSSVELEAARYDTNALFEELIDHANTNRVSFYTIGAPQTGTMAVDGSFDAALVGIESGGQVLGFLAAATGGRFYEGRSAGAFLGLLRQDFDTYYSLGYAKQPDDKDRAHRIEVRIEGRKGLRIHHRERYKARSREDEMADRTRTALVLGVTDNPLGIKVDFEEAEVAGKGGFRVPVLVKTPLSRLVLIPQGDFHIGRITVFVAAQDEQGRTSPVQRFQVPIRLRNDRLLGALSQVAGYRVVLLLRDGKQTVAVGVQDDLGIEQAVIRAQWTPTPAG